MGKRCIGLLLCLSTLCAGCTTDKRPKEVLAQEFSHTWVEQWEAMPPSEQEQRLPQGKIFLADLNGDHSPELFFVTPERCDAAVTVFDLSRQPIEELGRFRASLVPPEGELVYTLFDKGGHRVLYGESILLGGSAVGIPITEYYLTYDGSRLDIERLYRIEASDGTTARYYPSPTDHTELTQQDYEARRQAALGGGEAIKHIVVSGEDVPFLEEGRLEPYVLAQLCKWEQANSKEENGK